MMYSEEKKCDTFCDDACRLKDDIVFDESICSPEFSEGCKLPVEDACEQLHAEDK